MKVGSAAPDFTLTADDGRTVALRDLRGHRVLLFFYQKDGSPGCTVEACGFRDELPRFDAAGVTVFGISPDSARKHANFKSKHDLPFTLLSDPDHATCEAYGTWQRKLFWGRYYMGVVRTTFLVGTTGRVEQVWENVNHEGHADEVAAWLESGSREPFTRPTRPVRAARKK